MSTTICPKCKILIYSLVTHKCKREQDCGMSNIYNKEDAFMETVSIISSIITDNDDSSSCDSSSSYDSSCDSSSGGCDSW